MMLQAGDAGRRQGDDEAPQASRQLPRSCPACPAAGPDSASTPRGIGRPPTRDHNMLMNSVQTPFLLAR